MAFLTRGLVKIENNYQTDIGQDPVIFAFNHNSSYETLLVTAHLISKRHGKNISFIVDWMFGYLPIIGWLIRQVDPIFVYNKRTKIPFINGYREKQRRNVYRARVCEECVKRLISGQSLGIFPEGTRNRNPEFLLKTKKGLGYIALRAQVKIIPVGIDFSARIKRGKIPKFGSLILRIGREMSFDQEYAFYRTRFRRVSAQQDTDPYMEKINDYLSARISYAVMSELAALSGKKYSYRKPEAPLEIDLERRCEDEFGDSSNESCGTET